MISTYNEWDPLREVVVGTATNANWPSTDPVFAREQFKTTWTETPVPAGPVAKTIYLLSSANKLIYSSWLRLFGISVTVFLCCTYWLKLSVLSTACKCLVLLLRFDIMLPVE